MRRLLTPILAALLVLLAPAGIAFGACDSSATLERGLERGHLVTVVDEAGNPVGCDVLVPRDRATARRYDPSLGVFTSPDPVERSMSAPFNGTYNYAEGVPTYYTDPMGTCVAGYCLEFNPMDGINSIVNIGRGATGGLTDQVADHFTPGASTTVDQHTGQQLIGAAGGMAIGGLSRVGAGIGLGSGVGAVGTAGYDCLTAGGKPRNDALRVNRESACMNAAIGVGLIAAPGVGRWAAGRGGAGAGQPSLNGAGSQLTRPTVSWGGGYYRHGGYTNALEHIMYRHHAGTGFSDVSKFADGMGARQIKNLVDEALATGTVGADGGMVVDMGRVIGTNIDGASTSVLQVWIDNGVIRTAHPL